eukprot:3713624-Pyramimonas_sp.AAC.1
MAGIWPEAMENEFMWIALLRLIGGAARVPPDGGVRGDVPGGAGGAGDALLRLQGRLQPPSGGIHSQPRQLADRGHAAAHHPRQR